MKNQGQITELTMQLWRVRLINIFLTKVACAFLWPQGKCLISLVPSLPKCKCLVCLNNNQDLHERLDYFLTANYSTNQINVDDYFTRFHFLIMQSIDMHAPVVKYSRKQMRLHRKPWITKGFLVSIKRKQKVHKSHYVKGNSCEKYYYKLYSNLLTRVIKLAKRHYYHNQFNACRDNPKKPWDILRSLLPNKSISSDPNSLNTGNEAVSDPAIILEKFNSHFSNVGNSLASGINNVSYANNFHSYLKSPCSSSIYFHPTSPQEIYD